MILWCRCSLWVYFSWFPDSCCQSVSLSVFLSLLFLSLFLSFRHFQTKAYFKIFRKRYIALFHSPSSSPFLIPFVFFIFFPHPLMSWFPTFSLFCVHCKHGLCLTRSHWTFMKLGVIDGYILHIPFFLLNENCLNSVNCDSSFKGRLFPQNSFLHPIPATPPKKKKQALLSLGHVMFRHVQAGCLWLHDIILLPRLRCSHCELFGEHFILTTFCY